ncbi:MAG: phosphoribosylformylglycinamidine synthase [Eubacteriaceae bacterium]|nr:phosphoribosylformylglycinamidine synthase [Eubacteriaceae bacterium]
MIKRIFVEKKPGFDIAAQNLKDEITTGLAIAGVSNVRIINRYDYELVGPDENDDSRFLYTVFAEANQDFAFRELEVDANCHIFAVEYQPGQFDARSDAAIQCINLIAPGLSARVKHAFVYVIEGNPSPDDISKIKKYMVNPVDSKIAGLDMPITLVDEAPVPLPVARITGFTSMDNKALAQLVSSQRLACSLDDLVLVRDYFRDEEKRDPTVTEIKVLDTYWSDHCRHTTFNTHIQNIEFDPQAGYIKNAFERYLEIKKELGREDTNTCLMDMATIAVRLNKSRGLLADLEESDEHNACSYKAEFEIDGQRTGYLVMFKNETHNHPTEIEPFGGASTCLGGAIRDPLSGRSYVFMSMRVTGSADPRAPIGSEMEGKLPQRKITTLAAKGFSSYGNQIGLCTGQVKEYYHPRFAAKRMEVGAVMGAAPIENVYRGTPQPGDIVYTVGGRTGRDGIGGASGSSMTHDSKSVETMASEVQKGNPIQERKIQRLMRNPQCAKLIKKCNDFGAGGVSVAIGELADSLDIDLDSLLTKYEGLDTTELAISESQERMAILIAPENEELFVSFLEKENLEYSKSAVITQTGRLRMFKSGEAVFDIARSFIETNGAARSSAAYVSHGSQISRAGNGGFAEMLNHKASSLENASQKGMVEMFDSSIGAATVLNPYGGATQLTPSQAMACLVPSMGTTSATILASHGYDPWVAEADPFTGAYLAVLSSVAKLVCSGATLGKIKLSFQEYFGRLGDDASNWGQAVSALLGALIAQDGLGISSIGGKDSMSGTFENLSVPPTLISFAFTDTDAKQVITNTIPSAGLAVYLLAAAKDKDGIATIESFKSAMEKINSISSQGNVLSASAMGAGGVAFTIAQMCAGNNLGFEFKDSVNLASLFEKDYSAAIICLGGGDTSLDNFPCAQLLGVTTNSGLMVYKNEQVGIQELFKANDAVLEAVFPIFPKNAPEGDAKAAPAIELEPKSVYIPKLPRAPKAVIPVFPGTNCEYDTAKAFAAAGIHATDFVFKNRNAADVDESAKALAKQISASQILALCGGFSAADEPDGTAKFIVAALNNLYIAEAIQGIIERKGLVIGICNGFQALVKSGLLPYGKLIATSEDSPTLAFNSIGRHVSKVVHTRIANNSSPWLVKTQPGDIHAVAISHGEGRFCVKEEIYNTLSANGQIAIQYCNPAGEVEFANETNPNGSYCNIEAITSPDGLILGKMAHPERYNEHLYKNLPGNFDQKIFESAAAYFS